MSTGIFTVFGATGNQGGSVIDTILSSPALSAKYKIRAVTRDTTKDSSKALAAKGVEVVQADLGDRASLDRAIAGSYAVYGVTDFWHLPGKAAEIEQGKALADASFAAGVKHLIWSSLPHAARLTGPDFGEVPHFDSKAEVEAYIESKKAGTQTKASYFLPASFMSNLVQMTSKGPDGVPTWFAPIDANTSRIPWIDVNADTGKYVAGLLEAGPEKADGVRVQAVGEWSSPAEAVKIIGEVRGTEYKYGQIPREVYKGFLPEQIAEEITVMLELMESYHYYGVGTEKDQAENDKWLLQGSKKTSLKEYVAKTQGWVQ